MKERQLAVDSAKAKGQTSYSYESRFLPGIGYLANPEKFKEEQLDNLKQAID